MREGGRPAGVGSRHATTHTHYEAGFALLRRFDLLTARLSSLQRNLLSLAEQGAVPHVVALTTLFGLEPCRGRRGGPVFDAKDGKVNAARASLSRSLDRLAKRGLIERRSHSYERKNNFG